MSTNNFIMSSDYATLKNDNKGTLSLYLGQSPVLAYGDVYTYETSMELGTANASIRCQIRSDVAPTVIYAAPQIQVTLQATTSTTPATVADYPATAYVVRTSATTIKLKCTVMGGAVDLTQQITGKFQTITADIVTFLSPFN